MEKIKYIIREFEEEDLNPERGFLETLSNLSKVDHIPPEKMKEIFKEVKQKENSYIFVAVTEDNQVVGMVKLIIERKFTYGGSRAGHIEDVVVRKGFEKMGIASRLNKEVLDRAKKLGCYKVILDCRDELISFYEKFSFYKFQNCLRIDFEEHLTSSSVSSIEDKFLSGENNVNSMENLVSKNDFVGNESLIPVGSGTNRETKVVVLAAGKGVRMNSHLPKVLVPLAGRPMIEYLIRSIIEAEVDGRPVIVVSPDNKEIIEEALASYNCDYAIQEEQLGTGHALACARPLFGPEVKNVISFYGDHPFVRAEAVKKLAGSHTGVITIATIKVDDFHDFRKNFFHWGRIARDENGDVKKIVEFKDATEEEKEIKEINPGFYCFDKDWLCANIDKLKNNNKQGEYYLTDLVGLAFSEGHKIKTITIDSRQAVGINSPEELAIAEKLIEGE
ncbi:MAG: GNAT family N-acetyltransferase [Patescibacteria group bacterium]|nr:GNAT family N-acetyltransferase [Patescibacteria group bacterium]